MTTYKCNICNTRFNNKPKYIFAKVLCPRCNGLMTFQLRNLEDLDSLYVLRKILNYKIKYMEEYGQ